MSRLPNEPNSKFFQVRSDHLFHGASLQQDPQESPSRSTGATHCNDGRTDKEDSPVIVDGGEDILAAPWIGRHRKPHLQAVSRPGNKKPASRSGARGHRLGVSSCCCKTLFRLLVGSSTVPNSFGIISWLLASPPRISFWKTSEFYSVDIGASISDVFDQTVLGLSSISASAETIRMLAYRHVQQATSVVNTRPVSPLYKSYRPTKAGTLTSPTECETETTRVKSSPCPALSALLCGGVLRYDIDKAPQWQDTRHDEPLLACSGIASPIFISLCSFGSDLGMA
ncbi:hypothetical protein BDZ89DRAFT_1250413 [Hymenopellis radicata]|nr:hypothetical protein BDZ89DRAFT_1250413 [Hymenopellis radicata]